MTDQKPHIPSTETAESCFLDGAAGEFLPGDWHAFLAQVKRDAAREAVHGLVARWVNEFGASDSYVDMIRDEASDYLSENYPEETP